MRYLVQRELFLVSWGLSRSDKGTQKLQQNAWALLQPFLSIFQYCLGHTLFGSGSHSRQDQKQNFFFVKHFKSCKKTLVRDSGIVNSFEMIANIRWLPSSLANDMYFPKPVNPCIWMFRFEHCIAVASINKIYGRGNGGSFHRQLF